MQILTSGSVYSVPVVILTEDKRVAGWTKGEGRGRKRERERRRRRRRSAGSVQSVTHLGPSRLPPGGPSPPLLTHRSHVRGTAFESVWVKCREKEPLFHWNSVE